MFSVDTLRELIRHMEWADATLWRAMLFPPRASKDDKLLQKIFHLHMVQQSFFQVWTEHELEMPQLSDFQDPAAMRDWARTYYPQVDAYLASLEPGRLQEPVSLPWAKRFERVVGARFRDPTLADTIFQVTSHSTHHRGQITSRLRELGGEPPLVDYIAWVWLSKPAPPW